MDDAEERRGKLGTVALFAAAGLFVASALLPGALAVTCGVLGGLSLATGLAATVFAPSPGDDDDRQASRPPTAATDTPADPPQAVRLHVDAPASVRRWLDRVERTAEAEAAKRSR